jgi:hypothetical protein
MTDFEIRRELQTATGDRHEELERELSDRKAYRSAWRPATGGLLPIGFRGAGKGLDDL